MVKVRFGEAAGGPVVIEFENRDWAEVLESYTIAGIRQVSVDDPAAGPCAQCALCRRHPGCEGCPLQEPCCGVDPGIRPANIIRRYVFEQLRGEQAPTTSQVQALDNWRRYLRSLVVD